MIKRTLVEVLRNPLPEEDCLVMDILDYTKIAPAAGIAVADACITTLRERGAHEQADYIAAIVSEATQEATS